MQVVIPSWSSEFSLTFKFWFFFVSSVLEFDWVVSVVTLSGGGSAGGVSGGCWP